MSLEVGPEGRTTADAQTAELRALAHPLRLQMLSLLTATAMSAAEVARELSITHANASYHLRQLLDVGQIEVVEELSVRGGRARRYRYRIDDTEEIAGAPDRRNRRPVWTAVAHELQRRAAHQTGGVQTMTDAELWVDPAIAKHVRQLLMQASRQLHEAALPPRTEGAERVNLSIAMFTMEPEA